MMPMRLDMENVDPSASPVIFTTDTWEGYLTEREELLSFVKELNRKNLVLLSGDNHNSFAGLLSTDFENQTSEIVGAEFSVCGISSTSVFQALFNIVEKDSAMRPLITYNSKQFGGSDEAVENLNTAFLWGTKAALTAAKTGDTDQAKKDNNPLHNYHLRYVDSAANGIGVITVTAESVTGEFITIPPPLKKLPNSDPRMIRKAVLEYSSGNQDANGKNDLKLYKVEGIAPHPLT
jgi:alkaline phosphatase D